MTRLVFLDTETTGLDPAHHSVWEIAWAVNDGPIRSAVIPHTLEGADPKALELNQYQDRYGNNSLAVSLIIEATLLEELEGATIVGSNPAFDTAFLRKRWGRAPWHHRLLDVAAYGMGVLALDRPEGLASIADRLRDFGHDIPVPDHSAAGDVATLRAVYDALRLTSGVSAVKETDR